MKDNFTVFFVLVIAVFFVLASIRQSREEERLCRHTIQRHFGKSSEEAKQLMDETKEWESK